MCGRSRSRGERKGKSGTHRTGITPIIAVGETHDEPGRPRDERVTTANARSLSGMTNGTAVARRLRTEWAIGTGFPDSPGQANEVVRTIRACVPGLTKRDYSMEAV